MTVLNYKRNLLDEDNIDRYLRLGRVIKFGTCSEEFWFKMVVIRIDFRTEYELMALKIVSDYDGKFSFIFYSQRLGK